MWYIKLILSLNNFISRLHRAKHHWLIINLHFWLLATNPPEKNLNWNWLKKIITLDRHSIVKLVAPRMGMAARSEPVSFQRRNIARWRSAHEIRIFIYNVIRVGVHTSNCTESRGNGDKLKHFVPWLASVYIHRAT